MIPAMYFKCPLNIETKDTVCPACDNARPCYIYEDIFRLPGRKEINVFKPDWNKEKKCTEWRKKEYVAACGCGCDIVCTCGYFNSSCYIPEREICPFCGKECEIIHKKTMITDWDKEDIKI